MARSVSTFECVTAGAFPKVLVDSSDRFVGGFDREVTGSLFLEILPHDFKRHYAMEILSRFQGL